MNMMMMKMMMMMMMMTMMIYISSFNSLYLLSREGANCQGSKYAEIDDGSLAEINLDSKGKRIQLTASNTQMI